MLEVADLSEMPSRSAAAHAGLRRTEEDRRLAGEGRYLGDLRFSGMLDVAFVRAQVAHGRLRSVDKSAALAHPGVEAVVDPFDLVDVLPLPDWSEVARPVAMRPLCEHPRFVGAPLVAVVARDRYEAEDAAELVIVDVEELEPVVTLDEATASDAPRLFDSWPDNVLCHLPAPVSDEIAAIFKRCRVVSSTYEMGRAGPVPMEPRGVIAEWRAGRLTVWTSTQLPHIARGVLAAVLDIPERDIRVIAPDVGGAFGGKAEVYREEMLVAWLALRLRRPVRWIEDRHENLMSMCHSHDVRVSLEAAVNDHGVIEALRGLIEQDAGSGEMYPYGYATGIVAQGSLPGPYRIPHMAVGLRCVVTNKTPSGAYRGFGVPEAVFAMERLVDRVAAEIGVDKLELRRRMILDPDELPYVTATGALLQSGSHRAAFERAVELGEAALAEAQERHRDDGRIRVGLGVATYVEGTAASYFAGTAAWTHQESARLAFDTDGAVTASLGLSNFGQGTHTMVATIVEEVLGVPRGEVRVALGDSDVCPYGLGSWSSRGTVVAAGAIERAGRGLREKGLRIAAHLLGADVDDVRLSGGRFTVDGDEDRFVTWREVAQAAIVRTLDLPAGVTAGLESIATYEAPSVQHVVDEHGLINANAVYSNTTHVAVVKVDITTGEVALLRYGVAHDCGRVLNPAVVHGQLQGGFAQGVGSALYEAFRYDDAGQPLASTFMEYLLPSAVEVPGAELMTMGSDAPESPLGVKGCGESGICGPPAAITGAVQDALGAGAPELCSVPLTPVAVLKAVDAMAAAAVAGT